MTDGNECKECEEIKKKILEEINKVDEAIDEYERQERQGQKIDLSKNIQEIQKWTEILESIKCFKNSLIDLNAKRQGAFKALKTLKQVEYQFSYNPKAKLKDARDAEVKAKGEKEKAETAFLEKKKTFKKEILDNPTLKKFLKKECKKFFNFIIN